ncbi:MAG: right-handed parallel beta-helix repeat-containing protein, partial [Armatimonadetes bacterium]|nr:right-handed parallel beta-helix repeat-containing protein [Armatimonadota bacterium]
MKTITPLSLGLLSCLFALTGPVAAAEFHVAPGGSDTAAGTAARPLATLAGARDAVRAWKKRGGGRSEAVTVWLHGGTYRLASPVVFTPQDSGNAEFPVTYSARPGEHAIISGGVPITGWRKYDDRVWVAEVPWARERPEAFTQLFVNGVRRPRARTPNEGTCAYTQRLRMKGSGESSTCVGLTFGDGDLQPWASSEDAVICLFHNWVNSYNRVAKADWQRRRLDYARPAGIFFLGASVRYYVENLRSALDAPKEWYLDHKAGLLYYYPAPGEDLARAEVIAPVVKRTLVQLRGAPEAGLYVEHLKFRDLSFQHTDADLSPDYAHSVQGAHTQRGAIIASGMRNCLIEDCEFTRLGEHGISLREACAYNTISRCHIHDVGGGGVYLSEGAPSTTADWFLTAHNKVDSNFIHDGGRLFRAGCGVFMGGSASHNQITHNEISDLSWIGIHQGWSWTGRAPAYSHHNEIAYNHIHHLGNGVLNDIGGIYTLGVSPGTTLHHNLIHDVSRFERGEQGYGG